MFGKPGAEIDPRTGHVVYSASKQINEEILKHKRAVKIELLRHNVIMAQLTGKHSTIMPNKNGKIITNAQGHTINDFGAYTDQMSYRRAYSEPLTVKGITICNDDLDNLINLDIDLNV